MRLNESERVNSFRNKNEKQSFVYKTYLMVSVRYALVIEAE